MAYSTFYSNTSDTSLSTDLAIKQPDAFIMEYIRESTATLTILTTGDDLLTDAGAAFDVDGLISTVGLNLYIVDDNSKLAYGKVSDNDATTITFEAASMLLVEDGTTAPSFTQGTTYSYRVLTPSSEYAYGPFLGYTSELTFASEPEVAEFKYSIPRQLIREDLLENVEQLTFNNSNLQNADVIKETFGMTEYGDQTSQSEFHRGTNSFNTKRYQLTLNYQDVNSKTTLYQFFKTGLRNAGEIDFSSEEYKNIPTVAKLFRDTLRDSTSVDSWMWRKAD